MSNQQSVENRSKLSEIFKKFNIKSKFYELDELYWFIGKKPKTETKENVYLMSMVSRELRIIAGHQVSEDKSANRIQDIVYSAPYADYYCNV